MTVRIDVLMAVKDGGEKLRHTLDSLHAQTLSRALFRVCVYDDGSTDNTPETLKEYESAGKCVVIGKNPIPLGLTKTLNLLIRATRSELVARADCGDLCAPERLERQLAYLDAHSDVTAVCSTVQLFDPPDHVIGTLFQPLGTELSARQLRFKNPISHGSVMLRRSALEALNGYDESCRFSQDLDLWLRLLTSGRKFHWIRQPLYLVETDFEGISGKNAGTQAGMSDQIRSKYFPNFKPEGRRTSGKRMRAMARIRALWALGGLFRLAEALVYETRCRLTEPGPGSKTT